MTANLEPGMIESTIIVAAKYGFATANLETGKLKYIKKVWNEADGAGKAER